MPNAQGSEPSAWLLVELKAHARLRATPLQPVAMAGGVESVMPPSVRAVIVLDQEGGRIVGKYFDTVSFPDKETQTAFETRLFKKTRNSQSRDEADISILDGNACVYRVGDDCFMYIVGSTVENELVLGAVLDTIWTAMVSLFKVVSPSPHAILAHLALALLAVDEVVENGRILELDADQVVDRVKLKGAVPEAMSSYQEMTLASAAGIMRDMLSKQFDKA